MADANKDIVVTSINTYPLKSAKVAKVQEALVTNHGLEGDRTFMLIDGTKDRFLTQRKIPDMVKVSATYVDIAGRKGLKLSAPGAADLQFVPRLDGKTLDVAVWNHTVPAIDQGDEVAEWFSKLLGPAANYTRLVHVDAASSKVPVRHLPTNLQEALSSVYLLSHDDAPITLASQESLDELNGRLQERIGSSVPMNRFRMNIEVSGCTKPFDEDEWLAFRIGDVPFLGYYDKERCKVTCIDQETGEQDKFGPLDMLRTFRAPDGPAHAKFGRGIAPLHYPATIHVGDKVTVLERVKK